MALSGDEKKYLLKLASVTIKDSLTGQKSGNPETTEIESAGRALGEKRGAFVTLKSGGFLRGCIGTFSEEKPLYKTVMEMAVAAATHDPRFMPVTVQELKGLTIEISALTPLVILSDVTSIEVGRHGLYISKDGLAGVLLPQVATENNLNKTAFLEMVCLKAGLGREEWKEGATISTFEAEIFSEKK